LLEREESAAAGEASDEAETVPAPDAEDVAAEDGEEDSVSEDGLLAVLETETGAARLGPEVDEPYHRPLGDDGEPAILPESRPRKPLSEQSADGEAEAEEKPDREEDLPHDPSE
jgi:hypothetical protein